MSRIPPTRRVPRRGQGLEDEAAPARRESLDSPGQGGPQGTAICRKPGRDPPLSEGHAGWHLEHVVPERLSGPESTVLAALAPNAS